jgi:hypothetical protein
MLVELTDASVHAPPSEHRPSWPDTTSSVTMPSATNSAITPAMMSEIVKTRPLASSGVHLVEADRGQGEDGHVERVEQAPALKDPVADHAVDGEATSKAKRIA